MRLGLVQSRHNAMYDFLNPEFSFSVPQCLAMQQQQLEQNLQLLEEAAGQGYDLLVTTECINYIRTSGENRPENRAFYPPLTGAPVQALADAARRAHSWLVAGLGFAQADHVYNGALVFDREGVLRQVYRKLHLAGDESRVFTPGDSFCVQQTEFGRFGVCICWDMQFPETARTLALQGADLILCPTWGWEADLYGRARAYENGIYAAAAMAVPAWGPVEAPRTPSSLVTPEGRLSVCGPADRPALVCAEMDLQSVAASRALRLGGRRPGLYGALGAEGGPSCSA